MSEDGAPLHHERHPCPTFASIRPGFLALIALELARARRAGVREGVCGYEPEPVRYGLTKDVESFNPLRIVTHELFDMGARGS